MTIKIYIGADHRGFDMKQELIPYLAGCHDFIEVIDKGAEKLDENDDFNDPAIAVAKAVAEDRDGFGILICGSSFGVTMQANRFKGVRAANPTNKELAVLSREHNDANVICLSADFLNIDEMKEILYEFFHNKFDQKENHARRNRRLDEES